ncbi:MAG: HD domain-containing protein [Caldilineaceae bacterium]
MAWLTVEEARALYQAGDAAHDFDHVWRVTQLACHLAQTEGADIDVVQTASLLHDVPVASTTEAHPTATRRSHHLAAADFARTLLTERGIPTAQIENVVHCITAHRFRDQAVQPATVEAQCLYDADKLDSIGAIGVARAFAYAGSHESRLWTTPIAAVPPIAEKPTGADYTPVHEFVYKLQRILKTLHTVTAQQIGAERHRRMVDFFEQLDDEMRQIY